MDDRTLDCEVDLQLERTAAHIRRTSVAEPRAAIAGSDRFQDDLATCSDEESLRRKLVSVRRRRLQCHRLLEQAEAQQNSLDKQLLAVIRQRDETVLDYRSVRIAIATQQRQLQISRQWNVTNDTFHIWHSGPFVTINGLRLGAEAPSMEVGSSADTDRQPNGPIEQPRRYLGFGAQPAPSTVNPSSNSNEVRNQEGKNTIRIHWTEINSALGQVCLLLSTLEQKQFCGIRYRHEIVAQGSTSKIGIRSINNQHTAYYNLYSDDSFQLFGKRNFNTALQALVQCVVDAADAVQARDPTITLPHALEKTNTRSGDYVVGGLSVAYGTDGVEWTRAMKYLLTDIKQLMMYKPFGLRHARS